MKSITTCKFLFWLALVITCLALLASCKPGKELVLHNKPIVTKKARIVPGNAKRFQQRRDAKLKRQAANDSFFIEMWHIKGLKPDSTIKINRK